MTSLEDAIARLVRPGMAIYAGYGTNASLREVLRQFRGTAAAFTLVMPALSLMAINLLHVGLVRKVITSFAGAGSYPGTGPSPIVQTLCREKKIEIENWSLLSLTQRMMAGALGLPFLPTRSVAGTSMAEENINTFSYVENPFCPGDRVATVKALRPDLALIHGWAADRDGYTIAAPSTNSGKDVWGAKAANSGALVTVEKTVSTATMAKNGALADLPGHLVSAVCKTRFGAHPEAMIPVGLRGMIPYEHDSEFVSDYKRESRIPAGVDRWIEEWCSKGGHTEYLTRLGDRRIATLTERTGEGRSGKTALAKGPRPGTATERMLVGAAREIERVVLESGYKVLLTGVGTPALAGWLAQHRLKIKGYDIDLMTGSGFIGYNPQRGNPFLFSEANLATSRMITEPLDSHGVFAGGASSRCLSVLNAAQIDRYGNLNSTVTADGTYLVGSGGADDAANAPHVVVIMKQSPVGFCNRLPYVTTHGSNVRTVVSDMGVFRKTTADAELVLSMYFVLDGPEQETIGLIKQNCGWPLKVSEHVSAGTAIRPEELAQLRAFDPEGALLN